MPRDPTGGLGGCPRDPNRRGSGGLPGISTARRRLALVLAAHSAAAAAPAGTERRLRPGLPGRRVRGARRPDGGTVRHRRAGLDRRAALAGCLHLPGPAGVGDLAAGLAGEVDELVVVPADVPDLPGLVLAKIFRVLHRVDLAVAPEVDGVGCVALGVSLPLADWLEPDLLDLDRSPIDRLRADRVPRSRWALVPAWHRLRTPDDLVRLDPGLEGWEETRAARWPATPLSRGADGRLGPG